MLFDILISSTHSTNNPLFNSYVLFSNILFSTYTPALGSETKSTDIKLLKKTVKKKEIIKEKNQKEWKERIHQNEKDVAMKQKTRNENIQKRIDLIENNRKGSEDKK
jgi:hypothetical protein